MDTLECGTKIIRYLRFNNLDTQDFHLGGDNRGGVNRLPFNLPGFPNRMAVDPRTSVLENAMRAFFTNIQFGSSPRRVFLCHSEAIDLAFPGCIALRRAHRIN